jgi:DNA-binding response OmpR family regulator
MKEGEQARILVVDDDENIQKSLSTVLQEKGYSVDVAADGKEAIAKSKAKFYNLALVDIRLPDMDGVELLTAMRETVPRMVKIIITGYPSLENAIEAVNRGADGYMTKPYTIDDLLAKIKENLEKQEGAKRYDEERVKDFIETRAKEYESSAEEKGKSKKK